MLEPADSCGAGALRQGTGKMLEMVVVLLLVTMVKIMVVCSISYYILFYYSNDKYCAIAHFVVYNCNCGNYRHCYNNVVRKKIPTIILTRCTNTNFQCFTRFGVLGVQPREGLNHPLDLSRCPLVSG